MTSLLKVVVTIKLEVTGLLGVVSAAVGEGFPVKLVVSVLDEGLMFQSMSVTAPAGSCTVVVPFKIGVIVTVQIDPLPDKLDAVPFLTYTAHSQP